MALQPPKKRTFHQYVNLLRRLQKDDIEPPGPVATYLLETFVLGDSILTAKRSEAHNVCKKGSFYQWRDRLYNLGWVSWKQNIDNQVIYKPGPKLIKYVTREVAKRNKGNQISPPPVAKSLLDELKLPKELEQAIIKISNHTGNSSHSVVRSLLYAGLEDHQFLLR